MLEHVPAVEAERQSNEFVRDLQQQHVRENGDGGSRGRRNAPRRLVRDVAKRGACAGLEQPRQQQDGPRERGKARPAFLAVVAGRFVLVHYRGGFGGLGGCGASSRWSSLSSASRSAVSAASAFRVLTRMPPFVVWRSIAAPPPFSRPSNRRLDCSSTSILRSGAALK